MQKFKQYEHIHSQVIIIVFYNGILKEDGVKILIVLIAGNFDVLKFEKAENVRRKHLLRFLKCRKILFL